MGVSHSVLNEVLNAKRPLTTEYALLIEAAMGIDAGIFIRMQADYNLQTAKQNQSFANRLAEIRKLSALL